MKITTLADIPEQGVSHNSAIKKRTMLKGGDVPHLAMFSQARFGPGQVAGAHCHDQMCEVFFVQSGHGEIRINGKRLPLEPGVCVVAEPGEIHEVENTGSSELVLTYFGIQV